MKQWFGGIAIAAGLTWCSPALAECMVRPVTDTSKAARSYHVVVPAGQMAEYRARGYSPTDCSGVDVAELRTSICKVAAIKGRGVQLMIEQRLGASPARLCASAKLAQGLSSTTSDGAGSANDAAAGQ